MALSFRSEAIAAQSDTLHGQTCIAHAPRTGVLVLAAAIAVASLLVLAVCGQYTRKEHVAGYLAPSAGLIKVYTPLAGTVLERRVGENQAVKAGDVLLVISSERSSQTTRDAQAAVLAQLTDRRDSLKRERAKQAEIDTLAGAALAQRLHSLESEVGQARGQLELQKSRVASAATTLERHEGLVASRFISAAALQQKHDELTDQRTRLADLERGIAALGREIDAARNELAVSALKRANNSAQIERRVSEVEQQLTEADARRSVVLRAPADGIVTTLLAEAGQAANPATPLLAILPAGAALEAHLLVPTRAAGFVKTGQKVALRYQAFPYQRFGHHEGEVTRVGRSVIQPGEVDLPLKVNEPFYRVTVKLPAQAVLADGQPMGLQAGMSLDADIRIERRRIIEWVFGPLFAVTARI